MVRKSNIVSEELGIALDILAPTTAQCDLITNKEAHMIFVNMNKQSGGS